MDEFAQSREDDDLFADEFEPITTPVAVVDDVPPTDEIPPHANVPASKGTFRRSSPSNPAGQNNRQRGGGQDRGVGHRGAGQSQGQVQGQGQRTRGSARGGGAGVVGGAGGANGLAASRYATQPDTAHSAHSEHSAQPITSKKSSPPPAQPSTLATPPPTNPPTTTETTDPSSNPTDQPAQPIVPAQAQRTPAVRGDRSLTGGPSHKKLTEEELTVKLEKMAILNAQKAEKHRLSELDQAAFASREKELREKAVVEKRNERAMEMERARNRERKMKAQGGREWDSEKVEADIIDRKGRSSEYVRGGHGGVIRGARGGGLSGSRFAKVDDNEDASSDPPAPGQIRGHFEIRGRGNQRAGRSSRGGKIAPSVPNDEDFPALPVFTKGSLLQAPIKEGPKKDGSKVTSPVSDKPAGDWAEEMATPVEEKKMSA